MWVQTWRFRLWDLFRLTSCSSEAAAAVAAAARDQSCPVRSEPALSPGCSGAYGMAPGLADDPDTIPTFDLHHKPRPPSPSRTSGCESGSGCGSGPGVTGSGPGAAAVLLGMSPPDAASSGTPLGLFWKEAADYWQPAAAVRDLNPGLMIANAAKHASAAGTRPQSSVTRLFVDFCQTTRR